MSARKKALAITLLCALIALADCPGCCAESAAVKLASRLDLSALEEAMGDSDWPVSVRDTVLGLLDGSWEAGEGLLAFLREQARTALREAITHVSAMAAPMLVMALAGAFVGEALRPGIERVCALTAAIAALALIGGSCMQAARAAARANALAGAAAPVLATLVSASGGVGSAALLTPLSALAAQLCELIVVKGTIPLCGCCAILAACPAFSRRYAFSGVRRLLLGLCNGVNAALITGFTGLLAVRGLLASGSDSVSMHMARYTVDSLLPVIGGEISDSLDLLIASARLVRSCVGTTGIIALIGMCAGPFVSILGKYLALRACASLAEPLEAASIGEVMNGLADAMRALLVALASAMTLFLLIVGLAASLSLAVR